MARKFSSGLCYRAVKVIVAGVDSSIYGWMKPFLPKGHGDYYDWPLLTDVFPWQHSGVQYKRTWPIAVTYDTAEKKWEALTYAPVAARASLFRETGDRQIAKSYKSMLDDEAEDEPEQVGMDV